MAPEISGGRYRLEESIGRGAMSEVWAARDVELERRVAIKLLAPGADPARFEREARAAAALAHPNICRLYDYGEEAGRPFLVLEHLPGGTLEDRLAANRPLPDDETARIVSEIADGLAHAHSRGLVHRDLKPANILFDAEGRAKIADLGIALVASAGALTEAGTVLGTAAYISPEQAAGEVATPASDTYSLGVILFRMLSGRLPFASPDPLELARMHLNEPAPALASVRRDAPPGLEAVAMAALSKDPAERPADGAAVLAALSRPTTQGADTVVLPPRRPHPKGGRRRLAVGAAALALAGAGAAAAVLATRDGSPGLPASTPTEAPRPTAPTSVPVQAPTAATNEPTTSERTTAELPPTSAEPVTTMATQPPPPATTTVEPTTEILPTEPTTATTEPPPTTVPPTTEPPPTTDAAAG